MSKYAIILNTEENEFINKAIEDINKKLDIERSLPPHCTVLILEANDEIIKKFKTIEVKSITLNCLDIGTFENDENNTIYISVGKNKELLDVYNYYLDYFKEYELDEFSRIEKYTPHITLATHISSEQLQIAKEIVKGEILPKVIKIKSIALVNSDFEMTKRRLK